jgi:hypothetical protein
MGYAKPISATYVGGASHPSAGGSITLNGEVTEGLKAAIGRRVNFTLDDEAQMESVIKMIAGALSAVGSFEPELAHRQCVVDTLRNVADRLEAE